jgi:hypothetical protein
MTPSSDAPPMVPDDSSGPPPERATETVEPRCVFVVGMHRSGTSATAAVLARLGLESPPADELIPATRTNAQGHHESKALVRLNERLLATLGGSWTAPPTLAPGWEHDGALDALRTEAAETFAAVYPTRTAAWKDPRNCILLPFWNDLLGPATAAVLVYRDPLEVARSLQSRDGLRLTHGLALWERYVRSACVNLDGVPTLCTDYRYLLDDPDRWCTDTAAFLSQAGVVIDRTAVAGAASSVHTDLRHHRSAEDEMAGPDDSGRRILATLRAQDGPHHPWRAPDLGPEPDWVDDILAIRRDLDLLDRSHRALTSSRAFRFATTVGRVRGRRP